MPASDSDQRTTLYIAHCLIRLQAGDPAARAELLRVANERLIQLTRNMFRDFRKLRSQEETGDVFQNAALRLCRTLETVTPQSVLEFFRLAALQIRRELIDLARHYKNRPENKPINPHADYLAFDQKPDELDQWREFHEHVMDMPEEERIVFDLLFYQGLKQVEAAELLNISERTVQRRWRNGLLWLHKRLRGEVPPMN
jgi:RNA polymerase sigma factor (sigma-70 family)